MNSPHSRSRPYIAILAGVACLILAIGWLVRPRDIPRNPPPVPSETELQELARRAQRRSLESMSAYFAGLATDLRVSLAYMRRAGVSGIIWDESHIVTAPLRRDLEPDAMIVETTAGETYATWLPASRRLPLSVLEIRGNPSVSTVRRAKSLPRTGDWVVAVWQTDQAPAYAAANFRQAYTTACGVAMVREVVSNLSLNRAMLGGGLFNMDGDLLAAILPCGTDVAAIEASSVDKLLERVATVEERVLARYGVLFGRLSDDDRRYFDDIDGVLVREVWVDAPAESSGFRPGDVVVSLNDRPVASMDDLEALAAHADSPFQLRARRGAKTEALTLGATSTPAGVSARPDDAGLILESPSRTFRIDSVLRESRAARAGVQSGDRLVRINGAEPMNRGQVERALASTRGPLLLEIERDQRRIAIVVP